jgi:hypothetical protein
MLYTSNLVSYIINDEKMSEYYGGVLALDQLPLIEEAKKGQFYIVNTNPLADPGEHWVSIFSEGDTVEYFDPL